MERRVRWKSHARCGPGEKSNKTDLPIGIGEKSVLTAESITKADLHAIAEKIAESKSDFVVIDIPTKKEDVILVNKQFLVFFYATPEDTGNKKKFK